MQDLAHREASMTDEVKPTSRRTVLIGAGLLAAALPLAAPGLAVAGVVTQANAKYQNQPKNGAHCSQCNYFIAGPKPDANGTCKQVAGSISPNGWCQFFAKKAGAK
jgi:hypothetical protein